MSAHFSMAELTFSQAAQRRGLDNTPTPAILKNLERLRGTLEQVRALAGAPIHVSSGYRAPLVNHAVGGAASSAHTFGLAADITCPGLTPKALALLIRESGIGFDQLIYEGNWVHVGLALGRMRRQCLTAVFNKGTATYTEGIQ
jgi:uncharacterized protein YcbK (DUF882 family)